MNMNILYLEYISILYKYNNLYYNKINGYQEAKKRDLP